MLLTTSETADIINKARMTVFRWIHKGKFATAKKRGRDWMIESWEVMEIREMMLKSEQYGNLRKDTTL